MAPAQHEIDFRYDEALNADNIMTFKMAVRTIARRHGLHATLCRSPGLVSTVPACTSICLRRRMEKHFSRDASDPNGLSEEAYYFIGGIMRHIKGMAAITNRW